MRLGPQMRPDRRAELGAGPGSRSGPQWAVGEGEKAKALPVPGEDGLETKAGSSTCVSGSAWHLLASRQGPDSHQGDCADLHRLLGGQGPPQGQPRASLASSSLSASSRVSRRVHEIGLRSLISMPELHCLMRIYLTFTAASHPSK